MKKAVTILTLLVLGATSTKAQFPNNYAATMSTAWNPNVGTIDPATGKTPGTLTVTIAFSGSTQGNQPMDNSGAHHTPTALVKVGSQTQSSTGPQYTPSQNMAWSHTFSFDLEAAGCDFQVLSTGTCITDNESQIICTMMGSIHIPLLKVQLETAVTTSEVLYNTKGVNKDGKVFYDATSFCYAITSPPDFPGPDTVFPDVDPLGAYLRTEDLCWRFSVNGSFTGVPWTCSNVPRYNYMAYIRMERIGTAPGLCTNFDAGFDPSF